MSRPDFFSISEMFLLKSVKFSPKLSQWMGLSGSRNSSQFENNYFTEMCSGSEAGSYLRLIDFVYHSTLGLGVIQKKRSSRGAGAAGGFGGRKGGSEAELQGRSVERTWNKHARLWPQLEPFSVRKSSKPFKLFSLRSAAAGAGGGFSMRYLPLLLYYSQA